MSFMLRISVEYITEIHVTVWRLLPWQPVVVLWLWYRLSENSLPSISLPPKLSCQHRPGSIILDHRRETFFNISATMSSTFRPSPTKPSALLHKIRPTRCSHHQPCYSGVFDVLALSTKFLHLVFDRLLQPCLLPPQLLDLTGQLAQLLILLRTKT